MDQQIEHLIHLLEQTEFLYRSLLPIIDEEKDAAIHSDIDRLTAATAEKHVILDQIKYVDDRLKVTAQQLAARYRISRRDLRISVLLPHMPPQYAGKLDTLNHSLNDAVKKVQAANAQCASLVKHCTQLVRNMLGFFRRSTGACDVYSPTGNMRADTNIGRHFMSGMV